MDENFTNSLFPHLESLLFDMRETVNMDNNENFNQENYTNNNNNNNNINNNYNPNTLQENEMNESLKVILYQKGKDTKGNWEPLPQNGFVRVTKKYGKNLLMAVESVRPIPADQLSVELLSENGASYPGLSITSKEQSSATSVRFFIKLYNLGKKLLIRVISHNAQYKQVGYSSIFNAHNTRSQSTQNKGSGTSQGSSSPENLSDPSSNSPTAEAAFPPPSGDDVRTINQNLHVEGWVKAREFYNFSDLRLKTNINDIVNALELVQKLQAKSYTWKKDEPLITPESSEQCQSPQARGHRVFGLIAQDVQRILPEIVTTDEETGYLAVSYIQLIPILLQALNEFLVDFKQDNAHLETQIEHLQTKISQIENLVQIPRAPSFVSLDVEDSIDDHLTEVKQMTSWLKFVIAIQLAVLVVGVLLILMGGILLLLGYHPLNNGDSSVSMTHESSSQVNSERLLSPAPAQPLITRADITKALPHNPSFDIMDERSTADTEGTDDDEETNTDESDEETDDEETDTEDTDETAETEDTDTEDTDETAITNTTADSNDTNNESNNPNSPTSGPSSPSNPIPEKIAKIERAVGWSFFAVGDSLVVVSLISLGLTYSLFLL